MVFTLSTEAVPLSLRAMCLGIYGLWYNHMTQGSLAIIPKTIQRAFTLDYGLFAKDSDNGTGTELVDCEICDDPQSWAPWYLWYLA